MIPPTFPKLSTIHRAYEDAYFKEAHASRAHSAARAAPQASSERCACVAADRGVAARSGDCEVERGAVIRFNITRLESPIQARLAEALVVAAAPYAPRPETLDIESEYIIEGAATQWWHDKSRNFRADFAIRLFRPSRTFEHARLVVEADGKDFHDAARDARRDEMLLKAGWQTIRFTGREIYRDARGCADRAMSKLEELAKNEWLVQPTDESKRLAEEFLAKLRGGQP